MSALLPQHFALTEALVAAAGAFGIARTARVSPWFALGLAPFACAGLIGAIRIGTGMTGAVEHLHQFLSRPGALFGLGCLLGALVGRKIWLPPLIGIVAAILAILIPAAGTPAFVALIVVGAMAAYRVDAGRGLFAAASFALLLVGRLATDPLRVAHPSLAWHLFHLSVALWLLLIVRIALLLSDQSHLRRS